MPDAAPPTAEAMRHAAELLRQAGLRTLLPDDWLSVPLLHRKQRINNHNKK